MLHDRSQTEFTGKHDEQSLWHQASGHDAAEDFPVYNGMMRSSKTKSATIARPHTKYSASSQYSHCSLIQDNGEHDHADNDKYGDVLSRRHSDRRGLRQFDEHEKFNNNEYEKDLERVDVE